MKRIIVLTALALCALGLSGPAEAQTLYGLDAACGLWEFTSAPGGACPAPNPVRSMCSYCQPSPCGGPIPGPVPAGSLLGDVAVNCLRDTVFVTDGFVIAEYVGDTPCSTPPPCTMLQSFFVPTVLGMGPLTGMGMDELGTLTGGVPTLWITDGLFIAAIAPPAVPCGAAAVLCGPLPVATPPGAPLTDLTWDPNPNVAGFLGSLWACDAAGLIYNFVIPIPCAPGVILTPAITFPPVSCGLTAPLTGIAYDLATPGLRAQVGHLYVTDGTTVEYIDTTGAPATPQFYTPTLCSPTSAFMHGLAYASHGINYGFPRNTAGIGSYGQSCSPGPTFGMEWLNEPAGTTLVVLLCNFQFPGPGLACPPISAAGTLLWVDPFRPSAQTIFLPPFGGTCTPVPAAIPAGFAIPPGLKVYCQFIFRNGGITLDATEGLEFTITAP